MKLFLKIISSFLFTLAFANYSIAQSSGDKMNLKASKQYKRQATAFADSHEWVSFRYNNMHYYDDSLFWNAEYEVIIKYDGNKSQIFLDISNGEEFYLFNKDILKKIEKAEGTLKEYVNTFFEFGGDYKQYGKYDMIPRYFGDIPYYIYPIDFAKSAHVTQLFTNHEIREINGKQYNVYKYENDKEKMLTFVDANTNIMDSVYYEQYSYLNKDYYTFRDFSFENRQSYIDSIFNFENKEYEKYSKYDMNNKQPYHSLDTIVTDKLLDFPIVNLDNDTTTLREQEGWVLLNFWTKGCGACMEQLQRYNHERDSLGYRILENEGVKIMAIEYKSNNMDFIRSVAEKYNCEDITYSAKEIYSTIAILYMGYYYLITPDKKVVYKNYKLGDYSEILKIIEN